MEKLIVLSVLFLACAVFSSAGQSTTAVAPAASQSADTVTPTATNTVMPTQAVGNMTTPMPTSEPTKAAPKTTSAAVNVQPALALLFAMLFAYFA